MSASLSMRGGRAWKVSVQVSSLHVMGAWSRSLGCRCSCSCLAVLVKVVGVWMVCEVTRQVGANMWSLWEVLSMLL